MSSAQQFQPPTAEDMRLHRPLSGEQAQTGSASVEEITVNNRRYLVFPLIAAREMVLDYPENGTRELLPARHLQESVSLWEGTPITFVHPENERRTADDPREYTQTIIGQAYQPKIKDKEKLQVMAYIDVEKANDFGGLAETVVEKLKAGEDLGVSAGYATLNDDPSGGNYNGQEYDIEQGYIIPDHIAVFPNDEFKARCDWEDGCGAPRANYAIEQPEQSGGHCAALAEHKNAHSEQRIFPDHLKDRFEDESDARERAAELGIEGVHEMEADDGSVRYMPGDSHQEYEEALDDQRTTRLSACEVEENYDLDRETCENVRTLINEYNRSESLAAFKDRLDGTSAIGLADPDAVFAMLDSAVETVNQPGIDTPSLAEGDLVGVQALEGVWGRIEHIPDETEEGLAMVDLYDTGNYTVTFGLDDLVPMEPGEMPSGTAESVPTDTEETQTTDDQATTMNTNIAEGEFVQWETDDGTVHGYVSEIVDNGTRTVAGNEWSVSEDDDARIMTIEHLNQDGEPQNQRVNKLVGPDGTADGDDLRSWDAPSNARENVAGDDDPATLFQRFLTSIGYGKANAGGAEELMADVEDSAGTERVDDTAVGEGADDTEDAEPSDDTDTSEETVTNTVDSEAVDTDGDTSTQTTESGDGDTSDTETTMDEKENQADDLDLEDIAAKTAFGVSELEDMDDTMLAALERTVQEMSDEPMPSDTESEGNEDGSKAKGEPTVSGGDSREDEMYNAEDNTENATQEEPVENTEPEDDPDDDTETEAQTVNTDKFLTHEEAEEQFASTEQVEEVNENIEQIKGMVQNIQTEQEDEETEQKARMVANAIEGMSVEAAKSLPEEELDDLVETHATRTNYGGVPGQMSRDTKTNANGEDPDDYPAGGRSSWEASKAEGGD